MNLAVARPTADGYALNGTKRFITGALVCDLAVVVATTDRSRGRDGIALFLVEYEGTSQIQRLIIGRQLLGGQA